MSVYPLAGAALAAARRTIEDGGGTFDAASLVPVHPLAGYAVGLVSHSAAVENAGNTFAVAVAILTVRRQYPTARCIGTWVDGTYVHIDPVVIFDARDDALRFGAAAEQLAIYSFADATEVPINA